METNNTDTAFKEAFKNRTLQPSNSSWGRLSKKLDEHQNNKKKKRWIYFSYAASLLLILVIRFYFTQQNANNPDFNTQQNVVEIKETSPIVVPQQKQNKIEALDKQIPNHSEIAVAITTHKKLPKKELIKPTVIQKVVQSPNLNETIATLAPTTQETLNNSTEKIKTKKIKIDPNALLQAIANENNERLNKKEKHNILLEELSKQKLNLDAIALLNVIEKDIDNSSFKEKFMKSLKYNIENFATAFNERNK
ncbi:hypothetical protein ACFLSU_04725 [Bacteroidota bacterium]